jgi:hypothetical protein
MDVLGMIYREVEHMSTGKAAAAGGLGSGLSILAAMTVDPAAWAPWLQVATLAVGLISGLASLALVLLKIVQQRRAMRDR